MDGFRLYLQKQSREFDDTLISLKGAYGEGHISTQYYDEATGVINGQKLLLGNIQREYERTHRIWE